MATLIIGRHPTCDVVIDDPTVSRRHAELSQLAADLYALSDSNSTSGTFVLGPHGWKQIGSARVRASDRLKFGSYETSVADLLGTPGTAPAPSGGRRIERDPNTGEIIVRHK